MADFPRLRTGAIAQYPSRSAQGFSTRVLRFLDGSEQRWPETAGIIRRWTLHLNLINDEELSRVEEFFLAQQGQFGSFSFTDPEDGTVYPDCSFDSDTFRSQLLDEEWAGTEIVIRTNTPQ